MMFNGNGVLNRESKQEDSPKSRLRRNAIDEWSAEMPESPIGYNEFSDFPSSSSLLPSKASSWWDCCFRQKPAPPAAQASRNPIASPYSPPSASTTPINTFDSSNYLALPFGPPPSARLSIANFSHKDIESALSREIKSQAVVQYCFGREGSTLSITPENGEKIWILFENFIRDIAWTLVAFFAWNAHFPPNETEDFLGSKVGYFLDGQLAGQFLLPTLVMIITYVVAYLLNRIPFIYIPNHTKYLLAGSAALVSRTVVNQYAGNFFASIEPDRGIATIETGVCIGLAEAATRSALLTACDLIQAKRSYSKSPELEKYDHQGQASSLLLRFLTGTMVSSVTGAAWIEIYFQTRQAGIHPAAVISSVAGGMLACNIFNDWALSQLGHWIKQNAYFRKHRLPFPNASLPSSRSGSQLLKSGPVTPNAAELVRSRANSVQNTILAGGIPASPRPNQPQSGSNSQSGFQHYSPPSSESDIEQDLNLHTVPVSESDEKDREVINSEEEY